MKLCIAIMILLSLTSCSKIAQVYLPDEIITESDYEASPYLNKKGLIDISKIKMIEYEGSNNQNKRNEFIAKAILMSNRECALHKAKIISNANAWNVGMGAASILFAGTAAIINHAQTASELAASAAGASGVQALVNKEIYADTLGSAILRAIDVGRDKKMAILDNGMNNDDYPMPMALVDLRAYHDSCSLMAGLVEITKAFDNRKPSSNESKKELILLRNEMDVINKMTDIDSEEKKKILTNMAKEYEKKVLDYTGLSE